MKSERGGLSTLVMTPDTGPCPQMLLGMTRALGDFYHQRYGVTWKPEVVTRDLQLLGSGSGVTLCIATDGVWDHWEFKEAMTALTAASRRSEGHGSADDCSYEVLGPEEAEAFFHETRRRGVEAYGDDADNLTAVVVCIPGTS